MIQVFVAIFIVCGGSDYASCQPLDDLQAFPSYAECDAFLDKVGERMKARHVKGFSACIQFTPGKPT